MSPISKLLKSKNLRIGFYRSLLSRENKVGDNLCEIKKAVGFGKRHFYGFRPKWLNGHYPLNWQMLRLRAKRKISIWTFDLRPKFMIFRQKNDNFYDNYYVLHIFSRWKFFFMKSTENFAPIFMKSFEISRQSEKNNHDDNIFE